MLAGAHGQTEAIGTRSAESEELSWRTLRAPSLIDGLDSSGEPSCYHPTEGFRNGWAGVKTPLNAPPLRRIRGWRLPESSPVDSGFIGDNDGLFEIVAGISGTGQRRA